MKTKNKPMKTYIKNLFLLPALIAGLGLIPAGRVTAQTFTNLHNFTGGSGGATPRAGLILSGATLYGTTYQNDSSGGYGTVFKVNTNGTGFTNLHTFTATSGSLYTNSDGAYPSGELILSGNTLYGTAGSGGSSGSGTVFAVNTNGTGFTTLYSFTATSIPTPSSPSSTNLDGAYPGGGLILSGNTLYGAAQSGGRSGSGTVFAVNTNGTGFAVLHSFASVVVGYPNSGGAVPRGSLILSGNTLYGTAGQGGSGAGGTVFAVNINGSGFTNLHNFNYDSDGYEPLGGLILSGTTLYGTTFIGGSPLYPGDGIVFAVNTDGTGFTNLYTFSDVDQSYYTNRDGAHSWAGLVLSDNTLTLYGTTREGGGGGGTVFAVNTDRTGFLNLHNFTRGSASYPSTNSDGAGPFAGLILSGNTLYGTASALGSSSHGTVFALNPPVLTHVGPLGYSTGGTPARSSNPWQFTVAYSNPVSGVGLTVQSTLTTNRPGSWATLASMTQSNGNWSANPAFVPTGDRYFRVVASAPGWVSSVSDLVGPITVLQGFDPWGYFSYATTVPYSTATPWGFVIGQPSQIPGMSLRVQSSATPDVVNSWTDLPGGGQMIRQSDGVNWGIGTTNLPTGAAVYFRVIASASNYVDLVSAELGTFDIGLPLPVHQINLTHGGTYTLQSTDGGFWAGVMHVIHVVGAFIHLIHDGTTASQGAITLTADPGASVDLQVAKDQTLTAPSGVNVGPRASVFVSGTVNGPVSVGIPVVSNDGGSVVSHDGGSLAQDGGTAALAAQIAQNGLISEKGGGLISQDGGGLISQDGGGLTGHAGPAVTVASKTPLTPRPNIPAFTQPTFTGIMTVNGNYSQFPGTALIIGIAGTNTLDEGAQQFDQLVISGQANFIGGTIVFVLLDPDDQTNLANAFQPPDGATFDVVVASNILVHALHVLGPVWGDGLFFKGGVVTLTNGLQAVRLMATHIPPEIFIQNAGSELHLVYGTNYTGYTVQSTPTLSPTNWTTFSTGTNLVVLSATNTSRFFRLRKP
jgi:uncharacterized repeat protein (TIGR03803 family)